MKPGRSNWNIHSFAQSKCLNFRHVPVVFCLCSFCCINRCEQGSCRRGGCGSLSSGRRVIAAPGRVDETYLPDLVWGDLSAQIDSNGVDTVVGPIRSLIHICGGLFFAVWGVEIPI